MDLSRISSQDTLFDRNPNREHDVGQGQEDLASLFTYNSSETLTNELFGRPVSDFSLVQLPLVSSALSNDIQVHKDMTVLNLDVVGSPLISTSTSFLDYFKFKAPFMIINQWHSTSKSEFCRSYHKVLSKNLLCYILLFSSGDYLILYNNELKPYVDFEWQNLKFRVLGTTGTTSTFGNGLVKMYLVNNTYNTLSDGVKVSVTNPQLNSPKDLSITLPPATVNPLLDNLLANNKTFVNQNLSSTSVLSSAPFATFIDDNKKLKKLTSNGFIKIFDPRPLRDLASNQQPISPNGLALISVLLTLREQETRKNKGYNRPTYK